MIIVEVTTNIKKDPNVHEVGSGRDLKYTWKKKPNIHVARKGEK